MEDSVQSQTAIKDAARAFIGQEIERDFPNHKIVIDDLDPRLKLAACDTALEGFLPPGARLLGATTLGVRCSGSKPWTIYVSATVKAISKIVVAKRPLLRGTVITKNDVALVEREITSYGGAYIYDIDHVLGKIAKRTMSQANPLSPDMLKTPLLVRRGQQVTILAEAGGIEVRMVGTALSDGAEGQSVRVQNTHSKRTVEGQVVQPGVIRVNM